MRSLILLTILTLAFSFQSCNNQTDHHSTQIDQPENDQLAAAVIQQIIPALADIEVPVQKFTVKASNAQTLRLPSGSSIELPEAAFVDASGTAIRGDVELTFREFHNAAEIIASGIPMKVMSENGDEAWMQSAGMYEIKGFQHGQPVFIAPGKSLTVNLVSEVDGNYDFWKFDENSGNWDNLGESTPQPNPNAATPTDQSANVGPPPAAPIAYKDNTPPIDLDVNMDRFPELADKQGIVWQYAGKDPRQDPANNQAVFQKKWDEIDLQANPDGQTYTLTLVNDDDQLTLPVVPTLRGKDLEQALADYQQRLASYRKKLASASEIAQLKRQKDGFIRSYQVEGFGIYNYDILIKTEQAIPILANFDFGMDIPANMRKDVQVFLISGTSKMVVRFPPHDWNKFRFDPNLRPSLVAVLPGNQLATLSYDDLEKELTAIEAARGKQYTFLMKLQAEEVKSVTDMNDRLVAL